MASFADPAPPKPRIGISTGLQIIGMLVAAIIAVVGVYVSVDRGLATRPTRDEVAVLGDARWCPKHEAAAIQAALTAQQAFTTEIATDIREMRGEIRGLRDDVLRAVSTISARR